MTALVERLFGQRKMSGGKEVGKAERDHRRTLDKFAVLKVVLVFLLLFLASGQVAYAAIITVNTTDDELNSDGDCSLREAIQAANTDTAVDACTAGSGADTIVVPAGTYTLSPNPNWQSEDANVTGDLDITADLTITGAGAATTIIINGSPTGGRDRVFHILGGTVEISGLTIQNGFWVNGGGIYNGGTLTLNNSTVSGNTTTHGAGGIYNAPGATATLTNVTVSGNTAAVGISPGVVGGIGNGGDATLKNTIVANNTPDDCSGSITSAGHNLIEDTTGCTIGGDTTGNIIGFDPLLGPLQDNGGPTQTHALLAGSPAIDTGSSACPPPATDQRGVARPQGAACDIGAFELALPNTAPVVAADQAVVTVDEGQTATNSGTVNDPDNDPVALSALVGTVTNNNDGTWSWSFATSDGPSESQTVTIFADDDNGGTDQTSFELTVNNVAPTIDSITAPTDPVAISDQPVSVEVAFSDPGTVDTHDVEWDWGDGNTDTQINATSPASANHTYAEADIYTVQVIVTDGDGGSTTQIYEFIVIYDPTGGFVTGGGWIESPAGAYKPDPSLTGKANFGFVSKYKKGATVPTGNTEFQFQAGNLNFHSDSYQWLVIAGPKAMFKGEGTINGVGDYKFMIWAGDSEPDTFRIRIWDEDEGGTEAVTYDNGFDQEIAGGSVVIHTSKK